MHPVCGAHVEAFLEADNLNSIALGGTMSRRTRLVFSLLFVAFALSAAACADSTAPRPDCDSQSQNTCLQH